MRELWVAFIFTSMLVGGCWAFGNITDGWKAHDEKVGKLRRERGVTNSWISVRHTNE